MRIRGCRCSFAAPVCSCAIGRQTNDAADTEGRLRGDLRQKASLRNSRFDACACLCEVISEVSLTTAFSKTWDHPVTAVGTVRQHQQRWPLACSPSIFGVPSFVSPTSQTPGWRDELADSRLAVKGADCLGRYKGIYMKTGNQPDRGTSRELRSGNEWSVAQHRGNQPRPRQES
jgi:hypothetical protein